MTSPTSKSSTTAPSRSLRGRKLNFARLRPWVQSGFLLVWMNPFMWRFHQVPGCVFHCYACPLSTVACPVGLLAQFSAMHVVPFLVLGVLIAVGAAVGTAVCGWACPFGFMQDLLAKVPTRKFDPPAWMGYGRYVTLVGLVLAVPYFLGKDSSLFFCNLCPAGAIEGALGQSLYRWHLFIPNAFKISVTVAVILTALFVRRPWCRVLCPLGGVFALFNRVSVLHLRFNAPKCTECNLCRSRCDYGVKLDQSINDGSCIRCFECTTCPAIKLTVAGRET